MPMKRIYNILYSKDISIYTLLSKFGPAFLKRWLRHGYILVVKSGTFSHLIFPRASFLQFVTWLYPSNLILI